MTIRKILCRLLAGVNFVLAAVALICLHAGLSLTLSTIGIVMSLIGVIPFAIGFYIAASKKRDDPHLLVLILFGFGALMLGILSFFLPFPLGSLLGPAAVILVFLAGAWMSASNNLTAAAA